MKKLTLILVVLSGLPVLCVAARAGDNSTNKFRVDLSDFNCHHSDNFRIYFEDSFSLSDSAIGLLETVYDRYCRVMAKEGYVLQNTKPFTWVCFSDRQRYLEYSSMADNFIASELNSYYSATTNCVAVLTGGRDPGRELANDLPGDPHQISGSDFAPSDAYPSDTEYSPMMTHELIHQLSFNTGLQKRGVEYPLWLSEGMATAFEYIYASPDTTPDNSRRLHTIVSMFEQDRLIPLSFFVSMSRSSWPHLSDSQTYAQCWAFFDFLWKTRPAELKRYFSVTVDRKIGSTQPSVLKSEFTSCFGPVENLESDWSNWLLAKAVGDR